uniref:Uncharacterized protein n=1 Tax=Odontella aurita TaxID=265563 RepID=A0A7S4IM21_9STRA|mmetsp:Transcript_2718/g.7106  ORF Transcript_2718/g.7106 Transcript_2718/m.7106 type:complete len:181 (+) Transcript_2718:566-1108(+)
MVALDFFARHVVLSALIEKRLLRPGTRIMNTLASTHAVPFQSSGGVKKIFSAVVELVPPGYVPFTFLPLAVAADAWVRETTRRHSDFCFVGMFPGMVATDLTYASFPSWMAPILRGTMWLTALSETESRLAHAIILTSENVNRRGTAVFYNHLLEGRKAHHVALDDGLASWVYDWLKEKT